MSGFQHGGGGGHVSYGHSGSMHGGGLSGGITLGHLLGLGGHGHQGHVGHTGGPQDTPIWNSALQSRKGDWKERLLGMDLTPALLLGGLFLGMVVWLGVISYLRHHERGANQIFWDASRTPTVTQPGAHLNAIPAPVLPEQPTALLPQTYAAPSNQAYSVPADQSQSSALAASTSPSSRFGLPKADSGSQAPLQSVYNRQMPSVYGVPVQTAYGTRLRYTVSR